MWRNKHIRKMPSRSSGKPVVQKARIYTYWGRNHKKREGSKVVASPTLIYCAAGNKDLAQIAIDAGFLYGAQLPSTMYFPIYFADQDWKNPNMDVYITEIEKHRPEMATVLDLESPEQLDEVFSWAESIAPYVETVLIIPKYSGAISSIPKSIGGKPVRLAYSVPTRYGGTSVPVWEFFGWPIHLLGGSPHKQMHLTQYLDVRSVDGNMHQKLATSHCMFWCPGNARYAQNRWWPKLQEANDGEKWPDDNAHHEAFRRSCINIIAEWNRLYPP